MRDAQCYMQVFRERVAAHSERSRLEADRAIANHVVDPDAPLSAAARSRLEKLLEPCHRALLAHAVRRNAELGVTQPRLAPPIARLLAGDAARADRIASGLESSDPDPRAVIETERQLQAGIPSAERLAWIERLLDYTGGPDTATC
jgi:hypothetical protein